MGYWNDKVPFGVTPDPAALTSVYVEWITQLQDELKKAGRQVDRLERKLLIRSRKLGLARTDARESTRLFLNALAQLSVRGSDAGARW